MTEQPRDPPAGGSTPAPAPWRARVERNALWYALGAIAVAGLIVAVGVQVAPRTFYDHFWWEDIYGPLVVDAHQCHTADDCPGVYPANGVTAKDGYTVTSELTFGAILATMLYGIYFGLFRRYRLIADGWFVLGLTPWILLGPLGRVLEDANTFCHAGTDCDPSVFAFLFISPVIYIVIAVYVIAFLLLGVWIREHAHEDPRKLTGIVAIPMTIGLAIFGVLATRYQTWFSALPPFWFEALVAIAALAFFFLRARDGKATVNLTVFTLGIPFTAGCVWLILRWIAVGPWAKAAWNGRYFVLAAIFILVMAALVAAIVYGASRWLGRSRIAASWAASASRVSAKTEEQLGQWGGIALAAGLILAGILPGLEGLVSQIPSRATLIPMLVLGGVALLLAFAYVHVGREEAVRPGALLIFALGINVALVFAHMVDGLATWVALNDPVGFGIPQYSEKHPFSEFLLRYWDGFLFPFTKLLMVLVVAWMLDREARDPAKSTFDSRNMVGLVKMAIFVLGFAPGLRDTLRLAMGV